MTAVGYGILAMFGWGVGEFTAKKAVDEYGEHKAYFIVQALGVLLSLLIAFFLGNIKLEEVTISLLFVTFIIGITYAIAYLNAFTAYRIGKLAIVSPILCSYGMFSSILAAIFLKQTLTPLQFVGIAIIILGTLALSIDFKELRKAKFSLNDGVKEAIITFVFFGVNSVILDYAVGEHNVYLVNVLNSIFSLISVGAYFVIKKISINENTSNSRVGMAFLITTAVLTALANLWFILGYNIGDSILIAPLGASSGVITALLSFAILKERVTPIQLAGIIGTFIGIVAISL